MSMWAEYQKELWGYETLESDVGFISFQVFPEHIFLADLYVHPDFRRTGEGTKLTARVEELARGTGKKHLISRIDIAQGGAVGSLAGHLTLGFVPYLADSGKIWLKKELTYE